ncbi:MAG TPA: hypothetical protein VK054_04960 [Beutenbergiaceae bacterium]|nr:hypothetical protein [Beutenbergiaceae bacterium]
MRPIPLTADPDNPESPRGAVPVDLFGVESGGGGAVDSVNGQTGEVVLGAGDVGARPAGDVPWGEVSGKPDAYPPSAHSHTIADVDGLQSALDDKQPVGDYATVTYVDSLVGDVESALAAVIGD